LLLSLAKLAKTRIFGTPSEPLFNDAFGLPPSLLEDSLQTLAENNEKNMDNADKDMGYFKNAECAGMLTENYLCFCYTVNIFGTIFQHFQCLIYFVCLLFFILKVHFNVPFFL
jgi:hypothetical protein